MSSGAVRIDEEYIKPLFRQEPYERVLDVGCGVGRLVNSLLAEGKDAYGVDLPCLSPFWHKAGNEPARFFCSEADRLPFASNSFDIVISMGVIEHIGTGAGHCTLADDYWQLRQRYADELLRVTSPGGRIIITCPNKSFPADWQHEVADQYTPDNWLTRGRAGIFKATGLNIHKTWGRYHLLSHREVRSLFCGAGRAGSCRSLSLSGYFSLNRLQRGALRPLGAFARVYLEHMPRRLRDSFLNPYIIMEIRK